MTNGSSLRKPNGDGDDTLVNHKRKNPSDVDCYFEAEDSDHGEIKVMTPKGKIILLRVKGSDTIGELKLKIHVGIPFEEHELIFNEKVLDNMNTLAGLRIKKQSTLTLLRKSVEMMEIFVITLTGKTISLSVNPKDTIADVKWAIMRKERIDVDEQVLMFNKRILGDTGTLFDFHIISRSTVTLMHRSKGFMKIFIKILKDVTIALQVKPSYTITEIKSKIEYVLPFSFDEQELIFNETVLDNMSTVADYNIKNESILALTRKSNRFMEISIKTLGGEVITLEVKPSDTIGDIKSKIQDQIHIPTDEQELKFNEMFLDNTTTVVDFNINNESILTLMRVSTGCMHIFIKILDGRIVALKVKPSNTIRDLKSMIHEKEQIPPWQQRLTFKGRQLEDGPTLADYNIPKESTFHLISRQMGGIMRVLD